MKNPHGLEPTRFLNRKGSYGAIECNPHHGPTFGGDICIGDNCNREDNCCIGNDGTNEYECHPEFKSSLFVNTTGPNEKNCFSVLDYEVYTHN